MSTSQTGGLGVIALVSGGKDSFFSLLHCRANGHRVVALANLHPALPQQQLHQGKLGPPGETSSISTPGGGTVAADQDATTTTTITPAALPLQDHDGGVSGNEVTAAADEDEHDLNSFMYQTVGHQVIPLYAEATGIPLYRRAITGGATQHGKEYSHYAVSGAGAASGTVGQPSESDGPGQGSLGPGGGGQCETTDSPTSPNASAGEATSSRTTPARDTDETESMIPLLQAIKQAHPEANAICAGAILSTYQRTRVESVATRLGLTPLAYLWKFPVLPTTTLADPAAGSDAQLLDDMAAAGVEARIIKVASGGLDEGFLWTNVASAAGKGKIARAMRRFGVAQTGAVIGEGGEFETLVLDGPPSLFRKRIVVAEEDRRVVREGGGSAWLMLRNARLEDKGGEVGLEDGEANVRIPDLLDPRFVGVLETLSSWEVSDLSKDIQQLTLEEEDKSSPRLGARQAAPSEKLQQWWFVGSKSASIEAETQVIVENIRTRLRQHSLPSTAILSAMVVLRRMADFPTINSIYGALFGAPNPPSRVTISCGDALTATTDGNIAVYLTVHTALPPGHRQGLHVQSRSYWAPANIGPYSQAISIPVASLGSSEDSDTASGPRLVSIAGQIPLVPATMALPPADGKAEDGLPLQLTLSLQHLWRIGIEMGVQWWTSAVAYFPTSSADARKEEMALKARLAGRAWRAAHASISSGDDDDEDEDDAAGPDLWDRKYNPRYMSYAAGDEEKKEAMLPDRAVLASPSSSSSSELVEGNGLVVPPLFVAEVEELPRAAGVEWHAHLGIAQAEEDSVVLSDGCVPLRGEEERKVRMWQVVVRGKRTSFVQTVVTEGFSNSSNASEAGRQLGRIAKAGLAKLGEGDSVAEPSAVARYVDVEMLRAGGERVGGEGTGPMVPCRSLWSDKGERLASVTVYHSVFKIGSLGSGKDE
ncbi:hypothetical protein VTI74DRAFT_1190 [Chaetomium olivicolor]